MAEGTDCACCGKGVLLGCKRITFGGQKESFWKTTVFDIENDGIFMGLGGITAQATAGMPLPPMMTP